MGCKSCLIKFTDCHDVVSVSKDLSGSLFSSCHIRDKCVGRYWILCNFISVQAALCIHLITKRLSRLSLSTLSNGFLHLKSSLQVSRIFRPVHTCFFNLDTTNRSKSVNALLFSRIAICLACRVALNFVATSSETHFLATVHDRAPRGNLGRTMGRRLRWANEAT
jgi:hypothetical protein